MYTQHFGLIQYPFSLTPNTRYFLKLPDHQKAFDLLLQTMKSENAFAKITGEVGTGKTMLCRKVLAALESQGNSYITAYIPHPVLDEEGIMFSIAEELEIKIASEYKYVDLIKLISAKLLDLLEREKEIILLIDEAQAMPEETIEAVHLLTKVSSSTGKHMHVVLFGQPELNELLDRPALKHIFRHLAFEFEISALNRENTEAYVSYRLNKAGFNGPRLFTQQALNKLHQSSNGIPRLINILAHKALMVAFGKGDHVIKEEHILKAVEDTESARQKPTLVQRLFTE